MNAAFAKRFAFIAALCLAMTYVVYNSMRVRRLEAQLVRVQGELQAQIEKQTQELEKRDRLAAEFHQRIRLSITPSTPMFHVTRGTVISSSLDSIGSPGFTPRDQGLYDFRIAPVQD